MKCSKSANITKTTSNHYHRQLIYSTLISLMEVSSGQLQCYRVFLSKLLKNRFLPYTNPIKNLFSKLYQQISKAYVQKLPFDHEKSKVLHKLCFEMIIQDKLPFKFVNGHGQEVRHITLV